MNAFSVFLLLFGLTLFAYSYQAHLLSKNPDKPETFSEWMSLIAYHLGDWVSRVPCLLSTTPGYKAYQKLMGWSADLDKREKIWKTPPKP